MSDSGKEMKEDKGVQRFPLTLPGAINDTRKWSNHLRIMKVKGSGSRNSYASRCFIVARGCTRPAFWAYLSQLHCCNWLIAIMRSGNNTIESRRLPRSLNMRSAIKFFELYPWIPHSYANRGLLAERRGQWARKRCPAEESGPVEWRAYSNDPSAGCGERSQLADCRCQSVARHADEISSWLRKKWSRARKNVSCVNANRERSCTTPCWWITRLSIIHSPSPLQNDNSRRD